MKMSNKVSLEEAINTVETLDEISLPDYQPCIESINGSCIYKVCLDTNFEDKTAYVTGMSKYMEEAAMHAQLNQLLEQGNEHAIMLYTWRCCSRAIPQVKSNDQADRIDIYEKSVEVLTPHVNKLMQLMKFQSDAINAFCTEMRRLCHPKKEKEFISEAYLLTLGKFINMFAVLDELKNMKSSVKNDHSAFRRAAQFRKSDSYAGLESQNLSMFLATNDIIRTNLKKALDDPVKGVPGYDDILCDVINTSIQMFENKMYLLPQEKHILVKVIGFSLNLLDGDNFNINKLDSKKKINLSQIDKIFKQCKVVPLYGDMQISPFNYVMRSKNYDSSKWPACNSSSESIQGKILDQVDKIRLEHNLYISELAKYSNEIAISKETKRTEEEYKNLYNLALNGLQLLSKWTNTVLELYNWKLLHLTDHKSNPACPKDAEDYEKATKYNYSAQEKVALIEVISMIKGLHTLIYRLENVFTEAINYTTYLELQNFVQIDLREMIRKFAKSRKTDLPKTILLSVRDTCVDWYKGKEPDDDPAMRGKKDPEQGFKIDRPPRFIGPSSTQLYMVRTMLESLICDKTKGKKTLRKDIDTKHLEIIEQFHFKSFFWSYLLNFTDSLQKCCDLSQMWYREFYLEMTMGKKIQFPIEMSMPWILTSHILETKDQSLMEFVFYPLDLYNDAAMNALTVFKKRHLYDEVEAEVNLCFDQFVYILSEQIFHAYKQTAAGILLDKRFREEFNKIQTQALQHQNQSQVAPDASPMHSSLNNSSNHNIKVPNTSRYETLMKQRHIQLLGRSINLSRLISQRITSMLQKSLKISIQKFLSNDLTGIIELDLLVKLNRLTHKLLSKHLILEDFDLLFKEADQSVTSSYGKITIHILNEIKFDLLTNYCYNQSTMRFVPTKLKLNKQPIKRDDPPQYLVLDQWGSKAIQIAFQNINSLYSQFIGVQHLNIMTKYLGYQGIALIISEFFDLIEKSFQTKLTEYLKVMYKKLKKNINVPRYEYGSAAIMTFYYESLTNLISYGELRTNVLHEFTQIGNAIIISLLLEQSLTLDEVTDLFHASIYLNWLPKPFCKENENVEIKIKKLEQKFSSLQIVKIIEKLGNEKQISLIHESELLTRERLCCGLSIFEFMLSKIRFFLKHNTAWSDFNQQPPSNGVMNVDENVEFHRIWSAIQFIYCLPRQGSSYLIEELFGDGLMWAGCSIIALLGQQQRFEAFDHSYHLFKVNQVDGQTDKVNQISLQAFMNRIRKHQVLNQEIFAILNKYIKNSINNNSNTQIGEAGNIATNFVDNNSTDNYSLISIQHIKCFQPPLENKIIS